MPFGHGDKPAGARLMATARGHGQVRYRLAPDAGDVIAGRNDARQPQITMRLKGWIDCPLWTKEEGRSDLEVQLFARTAGDGAWDLDVTNILVP